MRPMSKKYTTSYKKKIDLDIDTFLPRRSPKGVLCCGACGAFFYRRRWTLTIPPEIRRSARPSRCPACRKIAARAASGELTLLGLGAGESREILRLLRKEEARAREKNPLGRIAAAGEKNGGWQIQTTSEKLAQRLGRALRKARGGRVEYKWSHNNKFVRVIWTAAAASKARR